MTDPWPNVDEFGRGSCTCSGMMTGCAVCSTADMLLRYGKSIPRLSDGTPNMRELGRRMGVRHRSAQAGNRHGRSLDGICTPPNSGTNWCTYCAYLELRANGVPVKHVFLSWAAIENELRARHPVVCPGLYARVPVVSEASYTSTKPARGRSDSGYGAAHMVVFWEPLGTLPNGGIRDFILSDPDFGSPSRPVVPPHSVWSAGTAKSFWSALSWSVCVVTKPPPSAPRIVPWWGSDVPEPITAAYKPATVATKLRSLGVTNYGKAINVADLEAGLKARHIDYGKSVQLVDVRALMKAGTA